MGQGRGLLPGIRALQGQSQEATARAQGLRPRCVHPQALPLRSHHFQKVGKKPELMLVWEPETLEQEPVQQVRTGLGPLSGAPLRPRPTRRARLLPPGLPSACCPPAPVAQAPGWAGTSSPTPPPMGLSGTSFPPLGTPTVGGGWGLCLFL